jgi:hypothetical protein
MEDPKPRKIPVIAWAPYFNRGKFMYWKNVGRGTTTIGKDGMPRTKFDNDAHAVGGSSHIRVLPEGETPEDAPGDDEQPNRPAKRGQEQPAEDEEGDFPE